MNKIVSLLTGLFLISACSPEPQGFEVRIDLQNFGDGRLLVNQRLPPDFSSKWIARVPIKDGKAVLKGNRKYPISSCFCLISDDGKTETGCSLLLDNSRITISGDMEVSREVQVTGAAANGRYEALVRKYAKVLDQEKDLSSQETGLYVENQKYSLELHEKYGSRGTEAYSAGERARLEAFRKGLDSISSAAEALRTGLMEDVMAEPGFAKDQCMAYFIFDNFISDLSRFSMALAKWDTAVLANPYVAYGRERYERDLRVQPGKPAPDFELEDLEGRKYRLSDYRGKHVLLVFSSSGCGWCVREIPFLRQVYEIGKGKDFAMFTIDLDWDRKSWEEVVRKHDLPWPVISDLKEFKSPVVLSYNIAGVPSTFLIDPEGKIEKKELRGDEMIGYIKDILKNN